MKNKNTYRLTEGAILLAIFTVLLLVTLYIPGLGLIVNFFLAMPFIMYSAKHGGKSATVFTIGAILLSLIVGSFLAIPIALTYGVTGSVIGWLIGKEKSRLAIYVAGSLVFLANTILQYAATVVLFNMNVIEEFLTTFQESIHTSTKMLESMGQTVDEAVLDQFQNSVALMETLMPSLFVMASFMIVFLIQLLCLPLLKRFGVKAQPWMPIRQMALPKSILWYYLLSMIASLFMQPDSGSYWHWALTNLVFILQFLMLIQGYTFIAYYSHVKGYPKAVLVVTIILSLLLPIILYIVRILGIIDLGFDLRKRIEKMI